MNSSFVIAALTGALLAAGCTSELSGGPGDPSAAEQSPLAYRDSAGVAFGTSDGLAALQSLAQRAASTPRVSVHASLDGLSAPPVAGDTLLSAGGGGSCSISGCSGNPSGCSITCGAGERPFCDCEHGAACSCSAGSTAGSKGQL